MVEGVANSGDGLGWLWKSCSTINTDDKPHDEFAYMDIILTDRLRRYKMRRRNNEVDGMHHIIHLPVIVMV